MTRGRGAEGGFAPLELAVGVLTILVPVALLVLSFGPWLERRGLVRVAAAEAARYVVVSGGDEAGAVRLVGEMAANTGVAPSLLRVSFCGGQPTPVPSPPGSTCLVDGSLERDGAVEVEVSSEVPLVATPFGEVGVVSTGYRHVELVDVYRSLP